MFRRIDRHIGEMRGRIDDADTLMLVSDHGMTRLREVFHVNSLFQREGLLAKRPVAETVGDKAYGAIERVKKSPLFENPVVKNPLARRLAEQLRQRVLRRRLEYGREGRRQPRLSEALID